LCWRLAQARSRACRQCLLCLSLLQLSCNHARKYIRQLAYQCDSEENVNANPNLVLSQDVVGKTHDCLLVLHDRSTGRTRQSGQDDLPALFIIA
jgi:hypothetical protein